MGIFDLLADNVLEPVAGLIIKGVETTGGMRLPWKRTKRCIHWTYDPSVLKL